MLKQMRAQEIEWGEDYRRAGAEALKGVLERGMAARVDRHLEEMAERGCTDRRNGSYGRWLMTELGEIELRVPRTRRFSALGVVWAYAQRSAPIDRMILACFVLGLSTRKAAVALQPVLGPRISPGVCPDFCVSGVEGIALSGLSDLWPGSDSRTEWQTAPSHRSSQ